MTFTFVSLQGEADQQRRPLDTEPTDKALVNPRVTPKQPRSPLHPADSVEVELC